MAEPYSTVEEAKDGGVRDEDALATAAALVQRWAPAPTPEPTDYADMAASAERHLFRYIRDTGGYLTGKSLSGVTSKSYNVSMSNLKAIVKGQMGDYYQGDSPTSIEVDSSFYTEEVV